MESVLLVNAPWALHAILRILTPLLPQRVVRGPVCCSFRNCLKKSQGMSKNSIKLWALTLKFVTLYRVCGAMWVFPCPGRDEAHEGSALVVTRLQALEACTDQVKKLQIVPMAQTPVPRQHVDVFSWLPQRGGNGTFDPGAAAAAHRSALGL